MTPVRAAVQGNPEGWFDILSRQPGAEVGDGWIVTGVPFSLCNSVFFPQWAEGEAEERIDAVLDAGRGLPQLWWLGPTTRPDDVIERLERRGVVTDVESLPAMVRALDDLPAARAITDLRIEPVRDTAALRAWAGPVQTSYAFTDEAMASCVAAFDAVGFDRAVRHHVGFDEHGLPVAAASVLLRAGVAGLYNVATIPEARGRGYGEALTVAALAEARDLGFADAILHASPDGIGIYRRLGFTEVGKVTSVETLAPA